jgi:hypothetical protein
MNDIVIHRHLGSIILKVIVVGKQKPSITICLHKNLIRYPIM